MTDQSGTNVGREVLYYRGPLSAMEAELHDSTSIAWCI